MIKNFLNFKWLVELAKSNPQVFSVAMLLIAVSGLVGVIVNLDNKLNNCHFDRNLMQIRHEQKMDSIVAYYRIRESELNLEVRKMLNNMIESYQKQLEEQKNMNSKLNTTLNKNRRILENTNDKIKNLEDGN